MRGWRGAWAAAQLTGVLVSSYVWLVVSVLAPAPVVLLLVVLGVACVVFRTSRPVMWARFGVRPASVFERDQVLAALVPMASMRGRRQPRVWVGSSLPGGRDALMPGEHDLVVGRQLLGWIANKELADEQVCAIVAHAKGPAVILDSRLVAAVDAYNLPWHIVEMVGVAVMRVVRRMIPLASFAWKIRWMVFAVAVVQSAYDGRWIGAVGAAVLAVFSWTTGHFNRRLEQVMMRLGDDQVVAEGFGPTLAAMIRGNRRNRSSIPDLERADQLERAAQTIAVQRSTLA